MKKIIIMIVTLLSMSALLASCTGNTVTDGSTNDKTSSSTTENVTENMTEGNTGNIIDEAESRLEDMSENATHGENDGTPGGDSTRGGDRTLFPRGK